MRERRTRHRQRESAGRVSARRGAFGALDARSSGGFRMRSSMRRVDPQRSKRDVAICPVAERVATTSRFSRAPPGPSAAARALGLELVVDLRPMKRASG